MIRLINKDRNKGKDRRIVKLVTHLDFHSNLKNKKAFKVLLSMFKLIKDQIILVIEHNLAVKHRLHKLHYLS